MSVNTPTNPIPDADLRQIIDAYNQVTQRLQVSHEHLTQQVQRLQSQLASANAALQRSKRLAALGEMAAGIAHEVRNPLASIGLYARMLVQDLAHQPPQADLASRIQQAVRGLDAVVNDVLTFSREIRIRAVDGPLLPALERAVEVVKPLIDQNHITIVIDAPEFIALPHDHELLHQALVNLIRNAAQAMPTGGLLTLLLQRRSDSIAILVKDTGPGIDETDIDRIFNPFFTTRATGTGLGLPIVHRIIDAHAGSIAVHNDPVAGGAVFTLLLPLQQPAASTSPDITQLADEGA
jgi:signal transduction histidine kinase